MRLRKPLALAAVALVLLSGAGGALATTASPSTSSTSGADVVECASACNDPAALQAGGDVLQQDEENTSTSTNASDGENDVVVQVDDDVRITEERYSEENATYYVTLENTGRRSTSATLTEVIGTSGSGGGTFGIEEVRLRPSETLTVAVDAKRYGGTAGVMVTTPASVSQGTGAYVTDTKASQVSIFDRGAGWSDVWLAVLVAIGVASVIVIIAAWHTVSERHIDHDQVDIGGGSS